MILEFIDALRGQGHAVESILKVLRQLGLEISARTYRAWKSPTRLVAARTVNDAHVLDVIWSVVWTTDPLGRRAMTPEGLYGRRKMTALVRRASPTASPGSVDRAMRALGLHRGPASQGDSHHDPRQGWQACR